jgi:hypothetical protein
MPSREVITFWLDMGAPISFLSRAINATVLQDFRTGVKSVRPGPTEHLRARSPLTRCARSSFCLPDAPGRVSEVRFAHSPVRLDPHWLNSLRVFDATFVLDLDDRSHGMAAVDVDYHEKLQWETPKPENLWRTGEVHERSGAFRSDALDAVKGRSDLWEPWLEHR